MELSLIEKLTNSEWAIENITTKLGTHDPDKIVSDDSLSIIDSGKVIMGKIKLEQDSSVVINSTSADYYFSHYNELVWFLPTDSTVRFQRYDYFGHLTNSFGYNIRFIDEKRMQWFIESIGIESGDISIKIITLIK
ncbi:MAG: hypothetical protein H6609_17195 [Ignavibacteriales bacterium]|nr:hypothetical protein [Ignavibacteriales bacterium]